MPDSPFQERLQEVRERMERAAARAHRDISAITLIAVTKIFPPSATVEAWEAGLRDFGENYVQEFEGKYPAVSVLADARFHLIGHLQSNKSNKAVEIFDVIQTVDSTKLARRLAEALTEVGAESAEPMDVFLEVKLSGEESKKGISPDALMALADRVSEHSRLRLQGLMTMPPWSENAELSRPYFARLRELAAKLNLPNLSMGMSHDLEVAIDEGATHIRVGTALFGKRPRRES